MQTRRIWVAKILWPSMRAMCMVAYLRLLGYDNEWWVFWLTNKWGCRNKYSTRNKWGWLHQPCLNHFGIWGAKSSSRDIPIWVDFFGWRFHPQSKSFGLAAGDITLHCRSSRPFPASVSYCAFSCRYCWSANCAAYSLYKGCSMANWISNPMQFAPSTAPLGAKTRRETLFALRNLEVKGPANLMNAGQTSTRNCVKWFWMKWCEGFMDDSH